MLRTSERSSFKRCEWQWYWSYVEQRRARTDRPALRFGTLIHQALAAYYKPGIKRGPHPAGVFEQLYTAEREAVGGFDIREYIDEADETVWHDAGELGVAILNNYVDTFGADDEWEVLATEQPFYQIVSDPDGKPLFIYVGTLDGLWKNRSTRKLWLPDHKTTNKSRIDTRYLRLDEQASAYWTWGVDWLYDNRILRPRQQLAGMIFNFLRKAMPDDRPKNEKGQSLNKDGGISKKQPPPYFVRHPVYRDEFEKGQVRSRALREFYRMQRMRNGEEVPDKSPSQMNCPFCHLLDICELHETGNDYQELIDGTLVHYDPYTTYEIEGERR